MRFPERHDAPALPPPRSDRRAARSLRRWREQPCHADHLGHVAGTQVATATLSGATGSPLTFSATATPGAAPQMIQSTGNGQAWVIGTVLPKPLTVTVADQYGNGASGVAISWQVTRG